MFIPLLLAAAIFRAPLPSPSPLSVPQGGAIIVNTGSTNTTGYSIIVQSSGSARYLLGRAATSPPARVLSPERTRAFFADLTAARPFDALPVEHCMKSASFGTKTYIRFDDAVTPDLSCVPEGSAGKRLYRDIIDIERQLHVPYRSARNHRYTAR